MENQMMFIDEDPKRNEFPHDFIFGVGTSAYQVEGAWKTDGKGLSIWDCFSNRHPEMIKGGANANVTVDNYHKMKEDVQLLKKMGVNSYRFSISWSRILPGGKVSMGKNMEGIEHYNKLIDELLANEIEPFVTLFHWDLPNALEEEYMGFLSSKIVDDFVSYADVCFWEFGDRVKNWVTLNEPYRFTYAGYIKGTSPPGRGGKNEDGDPQTEPYTVAYNLLNSHAAAYKKYHDDYKVYQKGKVGITLDSNCFKPYHGPNDQKDVEAVQYAYDFMLGLFMEPLTTGAWPASVRKFAVTPTDEYPSGRLLPQFSKDQIKKLSGSYDFLGINYYTANYARHPEDSDDIAIGYLTDCHYVATGKDPECKDIGDPSYPGSWIYLCPEQLKDLLLYVKKTYNVTKPIIITENGSSDKNDAKQTYEQARDDTYRTRYIKEHLKAIRAARRQKVNVMGYFVWSFMDSFEWTSGYEDRFGMIYVDYKNGLQRYPKNSAIWFRKFLSEEKRWPFKRSISESEQENEANDKPKKIEQGIEVSQKLKKAKA